LFSEIVIRGKNVFLENANLLKKINFPKICLILSLAISSLINFIVIFSLFILFLVFTGNFPGVSFWFVLPFLFLQVLFSIGICLICSILNVFFRDVGQAVDISMQLMFWITPIVYTVDILPIWALSILEYNPLFVFISVYQKIMLDNYVFDLNEMNYLLSSTIVALFIGGLLLKRHSKDMVDEL
jgi:lipopolysaccharide transport system permease protein